MAVNGSRDQTWHSRQTRAAFLEPILRFFDVAFLGLVGGFSLLVIGAPGGILFSAVVSLWHARPSEGAATAGALAQVTLTVWALVVSIGGTVYIEASRTIRTDARRNALIVNSARTFRCVNGFSRKMPANLRGELLTWADDSPPFHSPVLASDSELAAMARDFEQLQDYWNRRAGYEVRRLASPSARTVRMESRSRVALVVWRAIGFTFATSALVAYSFLGLQNIVSPILLILVVLAIRRGRGVLLGRGWRE